MEPVTRNHIPEESHHPRNMFLQVIASFRYAFSGLFYVLLTQRNMRFHFCIAVWVMSFAIVMNLTGFQKAYLFMVITFVFSMEVLNTCIEALTDILSPEYNKLAKVAKDTAAAAVLVVSIGSIMSAGYLLIPPFFNYVTDGEWLMQHRLEIIAVGIIVSSVLIFWATQVPRWPMVPLMVIGASASSFGICHLCYTGKDWISFIAIQFFSTLLFHSVGRNREKVSLPLASHFAGVIIYTAARMIFGS